MHVLSITRKLWTPEADQVGETPIKICSTGCMLCSDAWVCQNVYNFMLDWTALSLAMSYSVS